MLDPLHRLSKEEYGMLLAIAAKHRSEDRFIKVGAVIENSSGRIISTGYNGLPEKVTLPEEICSNRQRRRSFMIHAEINALSLIKRGEGERIYCTLHPCASCINAIMAHGIKEVIYLEDYINITPDINDIINLGILKVKKLENPSIFNNIFK